MNLPDKSVPEKGSSTPPKRHIEPVISGAVQAPRPATRRFLDFMFAEKPKELSAKIGRDVVVPRIKAGVEEALRAFIHGMFWGNGSAPVSNMVQGTVLRAGGTQYHQISSLPAGAPPTPAANTTSSGNYQDLVCPTQEDAERLLSNLYATLNQYRVVAVADLYEMARIKPQPSDNSFGWYSLDGARISKTRDGYLLELPRPGVI